MKVVMRVVNPAMFARSNRCLLNAFIGLSMKLDELTSGNEFSGFEKFDIVSQESKMIHMQLGMPIAIDCTLTPRGFDRETGFGRISVTGLLYVEDGKALSTHWRGTPIEGSTEEVVSGLATIIVNRIRREAVVV